MPENSIFVGKGSKYENPWTPIRFAKRMDYNSHPMNFVAICENYEEWFVPMNLQLIKKLKGKNLVSDTPMNLKCHADILLKIANSD